MRAAGMILRSTMHTQRRRSMRWRAGIRAAAGIVLLLGRPAAGQSKHRDKTKLTCGDFVS